MTPLRITGTDVSTKVSDLFPSEEFKWFRGRTANQTERDAMECMKTHLLVQTIMLLESLKQTGAARAAGIALTNIMELESNYEARGLAQGHWNVAVHGRHYHKEDEAFRAAASKLVGKDVTDNVLCTPDLLDALDLRLSKGKIVRGARFVVTKPIEDYDGHRGEYEGLIVTHTKLRALTADQIRLVRATETAHKAVADWKAGRGPKPPDNIVPNAHAALEASAVDTEQQHLFMMKPFSGYNGGWERPDEVKWVDLQDVHHDAWMTAVIDGDWEEARLNDTFHVFGHRGYNTRESTGLKFRFRVPGQQPNAWPALTARQVLVTAI